MKRLPDVARLKSSLGLATGGILGKLDPNEALAIGPSRQSTSIDQPGVKVEHAVLRFLTARLKNICPIT